MAILVSLAGLPGVGKSTVAKLLAEQTGALWLRVDEIETAIKKSDYAPDDLADLGYLAMASVAEGALRQGNDVITDCVNNVEAARALFHGASAREKAAHLDVVLCCSDPVAHRHRVETRRATVPGHELPDWDAVTRRPFDPFPGAHLTIDTADTPPDDAARQIAESMEALR